MSNKPFTVLFPLDHPDMDDLLKVLTSRGFSVGFDKSGLSSQLADSTSAAEARRLLLERVKVIKTERAARRAKRLEAKGRRRFAA